MMKVISKKVENSLYDLVFIHGWGGDENSLSSLAQQFENYYSYDLVCLKGFGDNKLDKEYYISDYLDDIKSFLKTKNNQNIVLIGHSFGGKLAVMLKREMPHLKVVAIAPSICKNPFSLAIFFKIRLYKIMKFFHLPIPLFLKGSKDYQSSSSWLRKTFINVHHSYLTLNQIKELQKFLLIAFKNDQEVKIKSLRKIKKINQSIDYVEYEGNHFSYFSYLIDIRNQILTYLKNEIR